MRWFACLPKATALAALAALFLTLPVASPGSAAQLSTIVAYAPSAENFPNPERGFFRAFAPMFLGPDWTPLTREVLGGVRGGGYTLVRVSYVIDEFRNSPLTQATLDAVTADLTNVRAAGLKAILRFMYSFPCAGSTEPCSPGNFGITDAPLPVVLAHIDQLAPVLQANADVIGYLEMGFVGAWGEWHNSTSGLVDMHFGVVNANSAAIVARILSALPARRAAVIRNPHQKQALFGSTPLSAAEAFTGSPRARVGAHNDCFLASDSGGATYFNPATGRAESEAYRQFLSRDNLFVPQGGETCSSAAEAQPFIQCGTALSELSLLRWSAINTDYQQDVIGLWQAQGCYPVIAQRLGYRFRLVNAELPTRAAPGGLLSLRLAVANDGWAPPYNPRLVEVVLRHAAANRTYVLPVAADPRFWMPGQTTVVNVAVPIPATVEPGTYQLLLNLPDPEPTLRARPEYSIRLANAGVWQAATGYNDLLATVDIDTGGTAGGFVLEPAQVVGSTVTLRWQSLAPGAEYFVEAGSGSGLANLYNASVGGTTALSAMAPAGTYYVRIRASSPGIQAVSNEVVFTVGGGGTGCVSPPSAPVGVAGAVSAGVAEVRWSPSAGATSYIVQAGPQPGTSTFFDGNVGATASVSSPVGAGFRAYARVYGVNACGRSSASQEVLIQ